MPNTEAIRYLMDCMEICNKVGYLVGGACEFGFGEENATLDCIRRELMLMHAKIKKVKIALNNRI